MRRSDGPVVPSPRSPGRIQPGGAPRHARRRAAFAHRPGELRLAVSGGLATVLAGVAVGLSHPLPAWCAAIAIAVRLAGGTQYTVAVVRRRARPNIVTWFLWGLTPMIAVAAQAGRPGPEVAVTFVLGLGPLVVSAVAFRIDRSASRLTPFTVGCAIASSAGIALWQITAMPELAIAFCILADLLATLPTLRKAYGAPESEYAPPYLLSILAMLVTLGTVDGGGFTAYGFPLYMLLINVTLFAFAALPIARIVGGARADRITSPHPARHVLPPGYRPASV